MQIDLSAPGARLPFHIRNLRFPFPVEIETSTPGAWCGEASRMRRLLPGRHAVFPPLHALNIELLQASSITIKLSRDASCDRTRRPLTLVIALLVFLQPSRPWTRGDIAAHFSIPVPVLSRRIFAEGSSLRETVLGYRLSRLFWDLPILERIDRDVVSAYGLPDRCKLEDSMFERFGLSLERLRRSLSTSPDSEGVLCRREGTASSEVFVEVSGIGRQDAGDNARQDARAARRPASGSIVLLDDIESLKAAFGEHEIAGGDQRLHVVI